MTGPVVVVVGSVNVDLVMTLPRLPGAGETVTGAHFQELAGGKGANQACAAARLGARTFLLGCVGEDHYGRRARADLASAGVDTTWLRTSPRATGVATVLVDGSAENAIAVAPGANDDVTPAAVEEAMAALPVRDAVVLACLEVPLEAVTAAARVAAARGWPVVLNPAPARPLPPDLVGRVAVLTPNEHEVPLVAPAGPRALLQTGVGALLVTRGAAGVDVHRPGHPVAHQPAFPVRAVDTTGAGDAFNGTLAWALAAGRTLPAAVRWATVAGALATRAVGARVALARVDELDDALAVLAPPA